MIESNSGYYFKFMVKDNNYFFLAAIANIFNKTIDELKNSNTFDGTLESIARVAGVDYKPKVVKFIYKY